MYLPKADTDADVGEASMRTNRRTKKLENKLIPTPQQDITTYLQNWK